jgi:WD40 repeat protein
VRVRTERTGRIFDLHEPFRSGGEGAIYEVPYYPNLVAKVYHAQRRTPERIAKLQIMVAHPPVNPTEHLNHPSIAWPTELLRDTATNQLVGFVMPRVRQMLPLSEVYNPRARRRQLPLFNYRYLVRTARNLCAAVQAVHQAGYVIGDLNESNVLVSDQALVTLVDADSFQVRDPETGVVYRSLVGKPEYTPPELQGCSFADVDRQPEHDAFALAVLIFRLLMEGFHPFDGVYRGRGEPPELGARIRNGYFPYARGRTGIEPSPLAPPFEMLHPNLQALFVRCFAEGHRNRSVRPRVEDWLEALEGAEDALQQCGQNEQHYYWVHWSGCPWCARQQALGGRDPFPSRASVSSGQHLGVSGSQQPLPSASATTPAPTPVHLGRVSDGSLVRTLTGHTGFVRSVSFSPDGSLLASGSADDTIKLWRVSDGSLVRTLTGHTGFVRSVSFSPDGSLLASGSADDTIKLWRVSDGSLVRTLTGHTGQVYSVAFSPDGRLLASGSRDKTIKLWSTTATQSVPAGQVHTAPRSTPALQSAPSSQPSGYAPTPPPTPAPAQASRRRYGAWVWIWSVLAILLIGLCVINLLPDGSLVRTLTGHTYWVQSVSFSPDGSLLASGSGDKTIKLWRVADGSLVRTLTGHTWAVTSVSFSPDGRLLASGSVDKTIKLWRVSDGALVRTLTGHTWAVTSVSFSPDGRLLASGSRDKTIKLWRVADGALR